MKHFTAYVSELWSVDEKLIEFRQITELQSVKTSVQATECFCTSKKPNRVSLVVSRDFCLLSNIMGLNDALNVVLTAPNVT